MKKANKVETDNQWVSLNEHNHCEKKKNKTATDNQWTSTTKNNTTSIE